MTAWLRMIICFGLALMLCSLLVTGEISLFVHPKFRWLIGVSIAFLMILGLIQLWNLDGKEMHTIRHWSYAIVLLPLILFVVVPPKALDASIAAKKGVTYMDSKAIAKQKESAKQTEKEDPGEDVVQSFRKKVEPLKKKSIIEIDEENYGELYTLIYSFPSELKGKKIKVKGFVYLDPNIQQNEFVLGRFTVTCCTADASVIGFVFKTEKPFKENQWLEATGTIQTRKENGADVPVIRLDSYELIPAPKDPYVYF
ncbi:TIGR03943 family putative permease subunit [Thermoflavimicrobium dichotomicum]|uniref:Putative membrane protein n=1 Tax=Thermoflavimicrobium dichotomicum TaxID=46223 RepID=A0A1I3JUQ5_9BACL|nr:TIGR03943 family protein [Thermoflavimicrobium dichotomicum]SFI63886.1 putative membrane protein [Thermoflavimicrobium dichotomicum]